MTRFTKHAFAACLALSPTLACGQAMSMDDLVARLAARPDAEDHARLWRAFRAEATLEAAVGALKVLDGLGYPHGTTAEACATHATDLESSLRANPVSVALRHAALRCAEAAGDTAAASTHEAVLGALLAGATRDGAGRSDELPIAITSEIDVIGFAEATGLELVGAHLVPSTRPRHLLVEAWLLDREAGTERELSFDFLDTWLALARDLDVARYPVGGSGSAREYLASAAEQGNLGARIGLALASDRRTAEGRAQATAMLRGAIAAGSKPATILLARGCFSAPKLWDCDGREMDAVLELAEGGSGHALVVLAAAYLTGEGVRRDAESSRRLLAQAEKRLGVSVANEQLAMLVAGRELRDDDLGRAGTRALRRAAEAGSARARYLLSVLIRQGEVDPVDDAEATRLMEQAAADGFTSAVVQQALDAMRRDDHEAARRLLARADARGDDIAPGLLALLHAEGKGGPVDRAAARRLLEVSAWRGSDEAARMLAASHLPGGYDGVDYEKARGWLALPATRGDARALARFAELLLYGLGGAQDMARADAIYSELAARGLDEGRLGVARVQILRNPDPKASRDAARTIERMAGRKNRDAIAEYARMLAHGRGVETDLDEATVRFRPLMANPDGLPDDFVLGMLFLSGPDPGQDPKRARILLDRAAQKGRPSVVNDVAWRLCVSRIDAFRDPPAGLELSRRVADGEMRAVDYSTRAACLAANGDFAGALAAQRTGLERVVEEDADNADRIEGFHARLAAYEKGVAWRE